METKSKFVALAWIAFSFGIAATVLIPIPILNNAGAFLGVLGIIVAFVAVFGSKRGVAIAGLLLSIIGLVGTILIQQHWGRKFDEIKREFDRPQSVEYGSWFEQYMETVNDG